MSLSPSLIELIARARTDLRLGLPVVLTDNGSAALMLAAEMKLPGEAVLSFRLKARDDGRTELQQIACFLPRGLFGILYWYSVMPFHHYVFNGMLQGIAKASGKTIHHGPERFKSHTEIKSL